MRIRGEGKLYRRIMEMGIVSGAPVEITGVAPLGDPIDILVQGYHLSLRKKEANGIEVEITEDSQCR